MGIVLLTRSCSSPQAALYGTWTLDGAADYRFEEDGTGALLMPQTVYSYTYTVKGDTLRIDFESDSIHDSAYTITVDGNTLTMVGGEGTAGGTYTLTKKQ